MEDEDAEMEIARMDEIYEDWAADRAVEVEDQVEEQYVLSLVPKEDYVRNEEEEMEIYEDMVKEFLGMENEKTLPICPIYRIRYPASWRTPTLFICQKNYEMQFMKYVPYQRISHFREHLNRLQYCQFVKFPTRVWKTAKRRLQKLKENENPYQAVKKSLKKKDLSRYNEHIHHMISRFFKKQLQFTYTDSQEMRYLFQSIEQQFKGEREGRKNMLSYYLVVQLILYLFHYHPLYRLPTLQNEEKRTMYYMQLLVYFSKTRDYQKYLYKHFSRKKSCHDCLRGETHFDRELTKLL